MHRLPVSALADELSGVRFAGEALPTTAKTYKSSNAVTFPMRGKAAVKAILPTSKQLSNV